ncbi:MAG: response regulator [Verrucomicrobiales bacterium]|nr:response regulator [Verrucomicrobiales bacterium]
MSQDGTRVILIDSDASVRRALCRLFASAGFGGEAYATGREFLAGTADLRETCIVADTRLPDIGILDLMRLAGQRQVGLPFILLTSEEDEDTRRRARSAGAAAFFRKPIDAEALLDSIRWALHSPFPVAAP